MQKKIVLADLKNKGTVGGGKSNGMTLPSQAKRGLGWGKLKCSGVRGGASVVPGPGKIDLKKKEKKKRRRT